MELSRFAARDVLSDAAAVCRPILAKHGNRLVTRADNCPDIIANREMLLQVLINLAVNSGKHTENGTVTFSAEKSADGDNFAVFTVSDTGTGISPLVPWCPTAIFVTNTLGFASLSYCIFSPVLWLPLLIYPLIGIFLARKDGKHETR